MVRGEKKDYDKQQSNYSEKYLVFGPWGPRQGPVLFNIFINEWEDGSKKKKIIIFTYGNGYK